MRKDLAKCVTETYRSSAGSVEQIYKIKRGGRVRVHPDPEHDYENEHGGFHSSSRNRQKGDKSFGDKLGALRGNLHANVGRPWDDVFSEFCNVLDRRSNAGYHIWTHLQLEVSTKTFMHNGVVCEWPRGWVREPSPVDGFYVHPVTGILEYKEPERINWRYWKERNRKKITIPVPGDEGWHYEQINGLWFRVKPMEVYDPYGKPSNSGSIKRSCNRREIALLVNF